MSTTSLYRLKRTEITIKPCPGGWALRKAPLPRYVVLIMDYIFNV